MLAQITQRENNMWRMRQGWSDASTNRGLPKRPANDQRLGERQTIDSSTQSLGRTNPELPNKTIHFYCLNHSFGGILLYWP